MRTSYLAGLWNLSRRRGDPLLPLRLGLRALGARLPARGDGLPPPLQAAFALTDRCPCRCDFCDLPCRPDPGSLDAEGRREVVRGLADLGVVALTFSGGEPALDPDLPRLVALASGLGLHVHVSTTGWGLEDPARASALVRAGLDGATLSVNRVGEDGVRPWRGALEALAALDRAAREAGRPLTLATTTVLEPGHLDAAEAAVREVLDQGIASAGVMPRHDPADPAPFAGHGERLEALALRLAGWKRETGRVDNSYRYLEALPRAARPDPMPVPCVAARTFLLVDVAGRLHPCSPEWLAGRPTAVTDRGRGLPAAWTSGGPAAAARRLRDCRACLWNCHGETALALDPLGLPREAAALMRLAARRRVRP